MARPRAAPAAPRRAGPSFVERHERWLVAGLLALHSALGLWVARENSVTYDENFNVPAGVRILRAGDFETSFAQPPLPKVLYAAAALAAGARDPDSSEAGPGRERFVGFSFMRMNADRYQRIFGAARVVGFAIALALAWLVWHAARAWHGPRAGLLALATWVALPESLAHGTVAGVDVPTALTLLGAAQAWLAFLRRGTWVWWIPVALWTGAAFLTRFSAVQIFPALAIVTALAVGRGLAANPGRAWIGLALLPVMALVAIDLGYALQISWRPLSEWSFQSQAFQGLQQALPWLRPPVADAWLEGVDYLALLAQPGIRRSLLLGQIHERHSWGYFPVAIAVKWPLGFLALGAVAAWRTWRERAFSLEAATCLAFMAVVLLSCMSANLDYGVRYALPMLPFACVWAAGALAGPAGARGPRRWALAIALVVAVAVESARGLPYPLAFYNALGGGPGRGDLIVNDSNVDWGQGLVALRRDLTRLGIGRVHLAYHGTVDPALYGLDYVPYTGGAPGPESDWLAVSSYFMAGLPARLWTMHGMSEQVLSYDLSALRAREPAARPANCMVVFRIR